MIQFTLLLFLVNNIASDKLLEEWVAQKLDFPSSLSVFAVPVLGLLFCFVSPELNLRSRGQLRLQLLLSCPPF